MDPGRGGVTRHPLPWPGLRVGQIWAKPGLTLEDGTLADLQIKTLLEADASTEGGYDFWDFALLTGAPSSEPELINFLANSFLLYDPMCPHLAPWAPPKK